MNNTCTQHPTRDPLLVIRQWQLDFCEGNHCAAALLSFFEYWHNIRLDLSQRTRPAKTAARPHGKPVTQDESLLQFHSDDQLRTGLLDLYGTKKIRESRHLLIAKGVVTEHPNPNPRYAFDKTLYFQFHPDIVNAWLEQRYNSPPATNDTTPSAAGRAALLDESAMPAGKSIDYVTCGRNAERVGRNAERVGENAACSPEITTETTTETTTTPPPPSFTDPAQRLPPEGGSSSPHQEKTIPETHPGLLIFDGPLAPLSTAQQARTRQIVGGLDPETAQHVVDDWGQAIRTNRIQKSKWAWLEGVARKAKAGTFTPTTDAAERRLAENRHKKAQEEFLQRTPNLPLPPSENRPRDRPEGLKALLKAVSPLLKPTQNGLPP